MVANYIKDKKFEVKLLDFGLSKVLGSNEKASEKCGTLYYMSPEVLKNVPYNKSVDIWSLEIMFYEICSRSFPFTGKGNISQYSKASKPEITSLILNNTIDFPNDKWSKFSKAFKDLISKYLLKDSVKRITIEGIYKHEWMTQMLKETTSTVKKK